MNPMKKLIALMLTLIFILSIATLPADASYELSRNIDKSGFKTDYPYVFVHGMAGWGTSNDYYEDTPYWGGIDGSGVDLIQILKKQGIKAYAAQVGPLNSAWDRACELYAQLTGTVVDYGEAHSKEHNHERYGFSYEGNALMGKPWNPKNKINLVGHSFGGATIRLFISLMTYGSEAEIKATGANTSGLFTGGHNSVHSCVTISSPHNGSYIANQIYDEGWPFRLLSNLYNLAGFAYGNNYYMLSLQMSHYDLTPEQGYKSVILNPQKIKNYYNSDDNCFYDLTIRGARELNEEIRLSKNTYYYSYSSVATTTSKLTGRQKLIESGNSLFRATTLMLSLGEGYMFDSIVIEGDWAISDGMVPLASARYPFSDEKKISDYEKAIAKGSKIKKGRWYYMDTIYGMDHFDFCGTEDYPTTFEDFYFGMVETVNSR